MLDRAMLEQLADVTADPAVTITCALERTHPGNAADRLRLRHLVEEATRRVTETAERATAARIVERIERAVDDVDWHHPADGVALFVTAEASFVAALPFPVDGVVALGTRFALDALERGLDRLPRYRVLVLHGAGARCLEGTGRILDEVADGVFPVVVDPPVEEDTPKRDRPIHDERADHHRFVFRAVDRALAKRIASDPRPLVVVGVERNLAYFDEITEHAGTIAGRMVGDHRTATPATLARLVEPLVITT